MSADEKSDRWKRSKPTGGDAPFLDWLLAGTRWPAFATDGDGRLTWWNGRLETVTGRAPEVLEGLPAVELFARESTDVRDRLCDTLEGTGRVMLSIETAEGEPSPCEFDGVVQGPEGRTCLYVGRPLFGRPERASVRGSPVESGTVSADRDGVDGATRHRRTVETVRDGVFRLDSEWRLTELNRPLASMLGRDRASLVGTHATELIASDGSLERARAEWEALQRGEVTSGTVQLTLRRDDGEPFPAEVSYGRFAVADGEVGAVGVVRDVSERETREARLREHRDRLARLNRIGDAAAAALDPVLEAGSREVIERRVCERLVDSDLYDVAWIGRPEGDGSLVPRATAGADGCFHEAAERLAERTDHERSADLAFRRSEPVVNRGGWEREAAAAVREATGRDLRATMAIPLEYQGTTYGALTAYSTRGGAFSREEREALVRLGRAVGFAINAVGTRRLVHTHERTELEFRVGPSSSALAALSAAVDGECVLRWTTPATNPDGTHETAGTTPPGGSLHDLWLRIGIEGTADGADAVLEAADGAGIVEARVIDETDTGCTVDVRAAESIPSYVVDAGAVPREVVADGGYARVVAEAPADADTRAVVQAFTDATDAELVAKRTPGSTVGASPAGRLTEKQREALRTAETMGYFDWPREHTAEEVADGLGVASATLHYHLRAAQRTLVLEALETSGE